MKHTITSVLCLLLALLLLGCAAEQTPYEQNDAQNYSVSVRYDANGGIFTTNTSIIVDSYNLQELPLEGGKAQLALISPSDEVRGKNNAFTAVNNGYYLAGWYASFDEQTGVYADPWNFENDVVQLDPNGSYTASQPVLTLYAAWVPLFKVDFVDIETGDTLGSCTMDPNGDMKLQVPVWDPDTGAIDMYKFPTRKGYTFEAVFYDKEGMNRPAEGIVEHPGTLDLASGTAQDTVLTLYTKWQEGEWYHIYTAEQFLDNASVSGSYEIHADLDFEGKTWPTSFMHGNFAGTIVGNGHTFKNISFTQTNNSKKNTGLFGALTDEAVITDLSFENVQLSIKGGTRVAGANFGLLVGTHSADATVTNLHIINSCLTIFTDAYFGTDDYSIGLVSGMGQTDIDSSGITAQVAGEDPTLTVTVTDGVVTLTDTTAAE